MGVVYSPPPWDFDASETLRAGGRGQLDGRAQRRVGRTACFMRRDRRRALADSAETVPVAGRTAIRRIGVYAGVSTLANLYSQLSGVLAGFAFAGLTIYLTKNDLSIRAVVVSVSLFAAFAALVIVAILYALVAGESGSCQPV
jgi:hypothetical protein